MNCNLKNKDLFFIFLFLNIESSQFFLPTLDIREVDVSV